MSIRGSALNLIIVQQDAPVFGLLYFCTQLYMFRLLELDNESGWQ